MDIGQRLDDLDFSDDLCLQTHRLTGMKAKGERVQENGEQVGLEINIQKAQEMRIGVEVVERVFEYTYLGSVIRETGGTDEDVTARIRKDQSAFSTLLPVCK